MLRARPAVQELPTYHPPLGGREGLCLDFNENTQGGSPRVLARMRQLSAQQLARYPDREPLEALVAQHFSIQANEVLLTNGIDEAIHLLCETYLEPGDEVLTVVPTFAMYEILAAATGARVIKVPSSADFAFPAGDLLSQITPRTRLISIANPNNPTGTVAAPQDLMRILRSAPQAAVLIDEAYYEFYGCTLVPLWHEFSNLFVARTLSKAYGLAGLRVGMLAGAQEQIRNVRRVSSPYNVNGIALACLPAALADQDYVQAYVNAVCQGRKKLEDELAQWSIPYWPSQANFVLLKLGERNQAFIEALRKRGILVRDRSSDFACRGCVRITLGTLEETDRLLIALRESLEEIGARAAQSL